MGESTPQSAVGFDIHGAAVRVESANDELLRRIGQDFRYFACQPPPDDDDSALTISVHEQEPDYDEIPPLTASIYTPRNVCYRDGDITYIDYFGRALSVHDRATGHVDVHGEGIYLLHEIVYLTMLSQVGVLLERRGLHRMHALALGMNGQAALFMMPSGCGKTTLGLELLGRDAGIELLSDDSPLITRSGKVLPFPLRFGVLGSPPPDLPERFVYYMERMEFAPKYLISTEAFEDVLAHGEFRPALIFLGTRSLARECRIRRVTRFAGFRASVRHMIVGVGLYQGLEFILRTSWLDLVRSTHLLISRALAALGALRRARVYGIELGRDPERNADTIVQFLGEELGTRRAS